MSSRSLRHRIQLYSSALRLALAAQEVRKTRVDSVIPKLLTAPYLPNGADPAEAARAAGRACRLLGYLNLLNSCLTRSLVLGSLISDRPGVVIHIGFRPQETNTGGHAWISLDEQIFGFNDEEQNNFERYTIARSLPMQRPSGKRQHD